MESNIEKEVEELLDRYWERTTKMLSGCTKCNKEIHALLLNGDSTIRLCEEHYVILKTSGN